MDDEKAIRSFLKKVVTRLGYDVELTPDSAEAIESYRRALECGAPFGAVILDLTIPGGMGGRTAMRRLQEINPEVKALPVG